MKTDQTSDIKQVYDREFFVKSGKIGGKITGLKNKKKGKKYFQWIRSFGTKKKK